MPSIPTEAGGEIQCYVDDFSMPWESTLPVLMHHGFSRNADTWRPWVPKIASSHAVYRVEMRGCGTSSLPPAGYEYSLRALAEDVVTVLDALELSQVHFIGESSGGMVGLTLALHYPERVASVVTIDTPAFIPADVVAHKYAVDATSAEAAILALGTRRWCLETISARLDLSTAPAGMAEWLAEQMAMVPKELAARIFSSVRGVDLAGQLGSIKTPVLLLSGGGSEFRVAQQGQLVAELARGRQHIIDGYGHGVHWIAPDRCVGEVQAFWADLEAA